MHLNVARKLHQVHSLLPLNESIIFKMQIFYVKHLKYKQFSGSIIFPGKELMSPIGSSPETEGLLQYLGSELTFIGSWLSYWRFAPISLPWKELSPTGSRSWNWRSAPMSLPGREVSFISSSLWDTPPTPRKKFGRQKPVLDRRPLIIGYRIPLVEEC